MKDYLVNGKIILLMATSLLFFSCKNEVNIDEGKTYIWQGDRGGNYFELSVWFENDSVYSFITGEESGSLPGMKNSYKALKGNIKLSQDSDFNLDLENGIKDANIVFEDSTLSIQLVHETLDRSYFISDQHEVDFIKRMYLFRGDSTYNVSFERY